MTDRELLKSILKYCKGAYEHTVRHYNEYHYIQFNDEYQCIHLDLYNEELTEIPEEVLELKHLEFLDLNFNKLTYIPDELSYIDELYTKNNPLFNSKDKVEILFNKGFKNQ